MTVLLGAAPAVAQTSSSSSTSPGSTSGRSGSYDTGTTGRSSSSSTSDDTQRSQSSSSDQSTRGTYGTGTTGSTSTGSTSTDRSTTGGATTMTGRDTSSGKLGWMDRRFVTKAADSGTTEINLAKLATERASNPEVKSFAQKLVDDHTQVSTELKSLASQKNVKLDEEDLGSDRAYNRLSKKSGTEFDQEFVEHMIDEHEKDVKMFEKASTDAKDPELRAFAAKHVDHLREHLQKAESLRSSIMPTGRDSSSATSGSTGTSSSSTSTDSTSDTSSSTTPGSTSTTSGSTSTDSTSDPSSSSSSSGSTRPRGDR